MRKGSFYIPKVMANVIWAASRNSTVVNWGLKHHCTTHNRTVDINHLQSCALLDSVPEIKAFVERLKKESVYEWEELQLAKAIMCFTHMQLLINNLTTSG